MMIAADAIPGAVRNGTIDPSGRSRRYKIS